MKSGGLRFLVLTAGCLGVFLLLHLTNLSDHKDTETTQTQNPNCLFLAASPYFENGEKVFGTKKSPFFTDKEIQNWVTGLKKFFAKQALFFYLPLYRTKEGRFLIASKDFFPSKAGFLKISHHELSEIQNILKPDGAPATLKGFLKRFPKAYMFLHVFETDATKAHKHLTVLIRQPVFISSNNKELLDLFSKEPLFKTFYSFKHVIRLSLAKWISKDVTVAGEGLLLPQKWLPEAAVRKIIHQQGKMLFLKTSTPAGKTAAFKGSVNGLIVPLQSGGELPPDFPFCSSTAFNSP